MEDPCKLDFDGAERERTINLPVYLRIKPLGVSEESSIKVINETTVETNHDGRANKKATFTRVFQGHVGQEQVFDSTTASLLQRFLDGANVMTFAYGVTSSGKTYTIMGNHSNPGLVPRTLERIFGHYQSKIATSMLTFKPILFEGAQHLKANEVSELRRIKSSLLAKMKSNRPGFAHYLFKSRTEDNGSGNDLHATIVSPANFCTVWISVYEIYNEIITDLLLNDCNRSKRKPLTIGQDAKGRTFVKDLTQLPVNSAAEAYSLLQVAKQNLAKASTKLNDNSSRSHMVFNIKMVHWGGFCTEPLVNHFVIGDLAGSERQAKTGTSGMILKQASAINNSLLVLGRCLEALRKKDRGISAPFRDSKLTRILNPFFTLGGFVSLIICINPHMSLKDETMDTIRFSAIASEIVQEVIRPLDRLRKLRRMTQTCAAEPETVKSGDVDLDLVESWKDAVGAAAMHNGIRYLEIKASYFNDMARDILHAEKQLVANEEEIASLKTRLKAAELSKENIHSMYQDRMKEQRDKFLTLKAELKEFYENEKELIVSSLNEEIETYEQKYSKYRNGYAKVSSYLEEKVWPEISLFRERFGYLPEYPSTTDGDDLETKPENTIRFWQRKVEETENENQCLRAEMSEKAKKLTDLSQTCERLESTIAELRCERVDTINQCNIETKVKELQNEVESLKQQCDEVDALSMQVSTLREELRVAQATRDSLLAEYELKIKGLEEEIGRLQGRDSKGICAIRRLFEAGQEARKKQTGGDHGSATDVQVLLEDLNVLLQSLGECLTLFSGVDRKASNLDGTNLSIGKLMGLRLDDGKPSCEAPGPHSYLATLRDVSSKLSEAELLCKLGLAGSGNLSLDPQPSIERYDLADHKEEDSSYLKEANLQLRERLQEFQDSLVEKESVITAQAVELEDLRQCTVASEVFKTKAEALEAENRELRKRIRTMRLAEMYNDGKQSRHLVENRILSQLESSLEASSRSTESSAVEERSAKSSPEKSHLKKPKQRRRLRLNNDENSVLDLTLQESIQDSTPVRDFRNIHRKC